ncbi:unnamed protein product, partial [Medioppia subpectinata]
AGTCLPIYGVNEGESCQDDNDCEPGLRCLDNQPLMAMRQRQRTCQPPGRDMMKKQYSASQPISCIGSVDVTFAKPSPAVSSGAYSNRLFKARIG